MRTPIPINDLEVIGYANVLAKPMLPSVVPPVFRLKDKPQEALVPPYVFNAGHLCDATALSSNELSGLERNEEITLFHGKPFAARANFELWVDQAGQPHYEQRVQADANLLAVAQDHIHKAEEALRSGNTKDAECLCGVALCADDRLVDPLAIKAAIRRLAGDTTGEQLIVKMAAPRMTEKAFRRLVGTYAFSAPSAPPPAHQPPSDLFSRRPMYGMASIRS